jgi:hypothetical protein
VATGSGGAIEDGCDRGALVGKRRR